MRTILVTLAHDRLHLPPRLRPRHRSCSAPWLRQPVYERDFIVPTNPHESVELDPDILARRPDGYQRLSYLQEGLGYTIKPDMPTEVGAEREALVEQGAAWLRGEQLDWPRT